MRAEHLWIAVTNHRGAIRPRRAVSCVAALLVLVGSFLTEALAEHRTALLIDNTRHFNRPPNVAAADDITLVAKALGSHGFRISVVTDGSTEAIYAAVSKFVMAAPINGTGLIYYRGDVVPGESFDKRATPAILGVDGGKKRLPIIHLMEWLSLHAATAQNLIVLDDCHDPPESPHNGPPFGMAVNDIPANIWLGFANGPAATNASGDSIPTLANSLSKSGERRFDGLLNDACGWTASTCQNPLFKEPASRAVSPPGIFPGHANPGDEWVTADGSVFCYCPPGANGAGFWIGKYEVTLSKWPIPGTHAGVGPGRNTPTTLQAFRNVRARLARLTQAEQRAGRLPQAWEFNLPSAAQWEHAARAGSDGDRYFEESKLARYANFADRSLLETREEDYLYADANFNDGAAKLAPVGNYLPNAWGIHDVYGNVWEQTDSGVLCGGGWVSLPSYCRATVRKPALRYPSDYVGIRIVIRPAARPQE